jgi:branched-chain amino acid transport system substrate-binding protein
MRAMEHVLAAGKRSRPLAILLLASLVIIPLALACEGEEEGAAIPTPAVTGTVAASATPTVADTATPAPTPSEGGAAPGITDTEIILGQHAMLSGTFGAVYSMLPQTEQAYFKYINDTQGGVCGRQIVLKVEDNNNDPAKALEVTRKLLEKDKVFAIYAAVGDLPHSGVYTYLNEKGVPDLFIVGGAHIWGSEPEKYPWSVGGVPDYRTEGRFFGQYISENLPGKKVAVLWENQYLGWDGLEGVKAGLDPERNELVTDQSYEATAVDIRSQVINMKNAGAEVVVLYSTPGFTSQAIKHADHMDWHPQFLASYVNSDPILFQFVSAELAEGLISFNAFKSPDDTDDPAIAQHYEIMRNYGGPTPGVFTIFAQLTAELMVEALSRSCDNLTREGLMDAVESLKDYRSELLLEGVTVTISDTDHWTLQAGPMEHVVLEDGKGRWEYFGPVYTFD